MTTIMRIQAGAPVSSQLLVLRTIRELCEAIENYWNTPAYEYLLELFELAPSTNPVVVSKLFQTIVNKWESSELTQEDLNKIVVCVQMMANENFTIVAECRFAAKL